MNGQPPAPAMCDRLADVFGVDVNDVMALAGWIPEMVQEGTPEERELLALYRQLPPAQQRVLLDYSHWLHERRGGR